MGDAKVLVMGIAIQQGQWQPHLIKKGQIKLRSCSRLLVLPNFVCYVPPLSCNQGLGYTHVGTYIRIPSARIHQLLHRNIECSNERTNTYHSVLRARFASIVPDRCREATVRRRTFEAPSTPKPRYRSHKRLSSAARHLRHPGPCLQWYLVALRRPMLASLPCCRPFRVADSSCSAKSRLSCCLAAGFRWTPHFPLGGG